MNNGIVIAVCVSPTHTMSKPILEKIKLISGLGVEGDAHMGEKVKHRSRVAKNPDQPNLRQVHLIHTELHEELVEKGFLVKPGQMGENITTSGIDLLSLPKDSILSIGTSAKVKITGLRNPCNQLNGIQPGLMNAVLGKGKNGELIRKAGVMGIVIVGGEVIPGSKISIQLPEGIHEALERV